MAGFSGGFGVGLIIEIVPILGANTVSLALRMRWQLCIGVQDRNRQTGKPEGLPHTAAITIREHKKTLDE